PGCGAGGPPHARSGGAGRAGWQGRPGDGGRRGRHPGLDRGPPRLPRCAASGGRTRARARLRRAGRAGGSGPRRAAPDRGVPAAGGGGGRRAHRPLAWTRLPAHPRRLPALPPLPRGDGLRRGWYPDDGPDPWRFIAMMRILLPGLLAASIAAALVSPAPAAGQAKLVQAREGGHPAAVAAGGRLLHPVTLNVVDARLGDVLADIAAQADLALVYGNDIVPVDRRITLRVRSLPAADALEQALAGTNIAVTPVGRDQVVLAKRAAPAEPAAPARGPTGAAAGRVNEAETETPVAAAAVCGVGTSWRALTGGVGRYRNGGIARGEYTLRVQRLGYEEAPRRVVIEGDGTVQADFVLTRAPTELDAVVVTVTGEQRIRELGHSVGRIDADAVVRTGPVSSVSELLNARIPGVSVFNTSVRVVGEL